MKVPSFEEQFNKIKAAYEGDRIRFSSSCRCFCGTILNNTGDWAYAKYGINDYEGNVLATTSVHKESNGLYTVEDILEIEDAFMCENDYYTAIISGLAKLAEIHRNKGETIPPYTIEI